MAFTKIFLVIWPICFMVFQPSWQMESEHRKLSWEPELSETNHLSFENNEGLMTDISQWEASESNDGHQDQMLYEVETLFSDNTSMVLTDFINCLGKYNVYDCSRMLLLRHVKALVIKIDEANMTGVDMDLIKGLVTLKWLNDSEESMKFQTEPKSHVVSDLSHELNSYLLRLFKSRSLQLSLFPGVGLEFTPKSISEEDDLVCFTAKTFKDSNFNATAADSEVRKSSGGKKKKKGGGFNMMPMMIVPQMMMLGMLPFALANLKMMVMNAFMMNSMALNSAIFMTIRNMVFGPKKGPQVKYVNYGYSKKKVNKKPELILHSPAAFVKKPHRQHHHQSAHDELPPHIQYDDSESYQGQSPNYHRRKGDQRWKQKTRGDKIRISSKIRRPAPPVETRPHFDEDFVKNPQPLVPNHFENSEYDQSGADAPSSYLNNNQYLQPSYESFHTQNYNTLPQDYSQSPTESSHINTDDFQSDRNVYFSPSSDVFTNKYSSFESKNPYSSKYNEELSTSDDNAHWRS